MKTFYVYVILFSTLTLTSACAVNPVTGEQDLVMMSEQDEISLGRRTHHEVIKQYGVYDDPELQTYVQRIGERLATNSHRKDLIYRFTVVDSKQVNAFALPGGYIYITRGMMSYLNTEAELAAVLGHEIGHVTARHAVRQHSAAQLANIGAALGGIFIPGVYQAGGDQLVYLFGTVILRGYGREHELEADQLGAEYLARTNYGPHAMLDVIRVLKNQELFEEQLAKAEGREPRVYHGLFSTHPDSDIRLKEVIAKASPSRNPDSTFVGREEYLQKIDGLVFGDSEKEGVLRGRKFYHAELGFTLRFPPNWKVENRPNSLLVSAPAGAAMLQMSLEDINKRISPRDFMISRLGLKRLGSDQALNIHGNDAHTGLMPANTPFGQRVTRFTVIYFNNRAYIFAGATKDPDAMSQYDRYFLETAQSFHTMTDNEHALAIPLHLRTIQADNKTNFKTLAEQSPLEFYPLEQLRLINGLYPSGRVVDGMLLKVIE